MLKNDFLDFPRLHLTGEVGKSVRYKCQIFSGFNVPKLLKSVNFLTELFKKRWHFGETQCVLLPAGDL